MARRIALVVCTVLVASLLGGLPATAAGTPMAGAGYSGDFNGDGKTDVANFDTGNGVWTVGLSTGSSFTVSQWADYSTTSDWQFHHVGDFNGDGKSDIVSFHSTQAIWWVGLSTGSGFTVTNWQTHSTKTGWQQQLIGDFNGDGKSDFANFHPSNGTWWVGLSNGTTFLTSMWKDSTVDTGWGKFAVGRFNADNRDDIVGFRPGSGALHVWTSTGTSLNNAPSWATLQAGETWYLHPSGDFNGDGRQDVALFSAGRWFIGTSSGSAFNVTQWAAMPAPTGWTRVSVADFNADGRSDIATLYSATNIWHVSLASGPTSFATAAWGDIDPDTGWTSHAGGDFNGDGKADVAYHYSGDNMWRVLASSGSGFTVTNWNDPPVSSEPPPPTNSAPTSQFTASCEGLTCSFTNHSSDSDGTITAHQWSLGDGQSSSAQNPTHTYAAAGTYEVSLTVTDNAGAQATSYRPVTVTATTGGGDGGGTTNSAPTSQFTASCEGLRCAFTNHSSDSDGTITAQQWKFGNGLTTSAHSPAHTYAKAGTYEVSLTVTDDAGAQSTSYRPVTVTAPTTAEPAVVKRAVTLRGIRHKRFAQGVYLVARGSIKVPSEVNKCRRGLKVFIQKKKSTGWKTLEWNTSQIDGRYAVYVPPPHRSGKYRALVKKTVLKNGTVCGRDVSRRLHHSH